MTFRPNGNLIVTSHLTGQMLEYDGTTGAFVKDFGFNPGINLDFPWGVTIGPNGNVFVTRQSEPTRVYEYLIESGRWFSTFVRGSAILPGPTDLAFMPPSPDDCNGNRVIDACEFIGTPCCCVGNRGDANGDGDDANILDLTFLVDFIFRSSGDPGACPEEADMNSDNLEPVPNVLDLTFLVDFVFRNSQAPPGGCPQL